MYQALYRKYRPKQLDDICGQDTIVKIIKNSITNNKINHAYLFAGPRGTGKTSMAKVFAKIVNCENSVNCTPCGVCVNCTQKNNSDIIEIDAASNNGVDEIRELRSKVSLVPSYGKYKIYIIDEVHMLTPGAFNALLKTLEEPPAHIIFILATTDPHKLPETIISRCQRLDFKKISLNAIVDRLKYIAKKENISIEEDALYEIAQLSDGGMRDSLGMLDEVAAYNENTITVEDIHDINGTLTYNDLKEFINYICDNNLEEIFKSLDQYNARGKNFVKLTEEIVSFMRNLLIYIKAPKYFAETNVSVSVYKDINFDSNLLIKYIEELNDCILNMKNTNNPKLMLELAIIKMVSTDKTFENQGIPQKCKSVNNTQFVQKTIEKNVPNIFEKKSVTTSISNTSVKETKPNINSLKKVVLDDDKKNKLNELKKIRIDNTLSKFNKKNMLTLKERLSNLNEYLFDPAYNKQVSIILDGVLKAVSDENMIFVYKLEHLSKSFNENLIDIEKTIEKICGKHYNLISTDAKEWEVIKKDFNDKLRPFIYKEENIKLDEIFLEKKDDITTLFSDIIEYS